jgi:hypothetical protein
MSACGMVHKSMLKQEGADSLKAFHLMPLIIQDVALEFHGKGSTNAMVSE